MPATTEDSRLSNLWCQKAGATTFYTRKTTLRVGVKSGDGDEKVSDIPRARGFCDSPPGQRQGRGSPDIPRSRGLLSFCLLPQWFTEVKIYICLHIIWVVIEVTDFSSY